MKDEFYKSMLATWAELHFQNPSDELEILKQPLWYNSLIRIGDKPVWYDNWQKNNIKYAKDIFDNNGEIMGKQVLDAKYNFQTKYLEYESLLSAIPKLWKYKLNNKGSIINDVHISEECTINTDKGIKKLCELDTRQIYMGLLSKQTERPTSEHKWHEKGNVNISEEEWSSIYSSPYDLIRDTRCQAFQYKVTHRIMACRYNLKIWKIEQSDICKICNEQIDTIEHHLVLCPSTSLFWTSVISWWKANFNISFPVHMYDLIFGLSNDGNDMIINHFNYILLLARFYIYNTKRVDGKLDLYTFLLNCKNEIMTEYNIMATQNKKEIFEKRWGELFSVLS
jgi:hypothetical protein